MALELRLGGVPRRWHLRGDDELDAWSQGRPWLGGGATVSVCTAHDRGPIVEHLRRSIWSWDLGVSEVRIVELPSEAPSFAAAVADWLGVRAPDGMALASALGEELSIRPAAFLAIAADPAAASRTFEAAEELRDWVAKLDYPRAPTTVVLHPGPIGLVRGSIRADLGWPVGLVDAVLAASTEVERWRGYLHLRIACEVGGHLDDALACDGLGVAQLAVGDDAGCEAALNHHATRRFASLPAGEQAVWRAWGEASTGPSAFAAPVRTVDGVAGPWGHRTTPAPWMARALLQGKASTAVARLLRTEILCQPLVDKLLNLCFALESVQRGRLGGTRSDSPDDAAIDQYRRYQSNSESFTRDLYPLGHPGLPHDAWDFASLGAIQRATGADLSLGLLRNALAHGHHAGWRAIEHMRNLWSRAGG